MAEKTVLGLVLSLSFALIGVLQALSHEVGLVTIPNTEKVFLQAGLPFNITCKGSEDDPGNFASLQWLNKEGHVISQGIPRTTVETKNSLTLAFTDPKETESGVYKCVAVYKKEVTLQKSVSIIFYGTKPVFKEDYENVTALEKSTVEILCAAEGEHPIRYEWYNEKEENILEISQLPIHVSKITNGSLLVIRKVALHNKGSYTCLAKNKHGLSSKIFDLTVLSKDDDTTNLTTKFNYVSSKKVTSTSVVFRLRMSGPVKKIQVKYQESQNSTEYFKEFKYDDVYEVKDLIPAGRYDFKFKTFPSTDHAWSRSETVILLPSKPEVIFRQIDSGIVKLEWDFKFEDRMRKTIDRHEISYFTLQMVGGVSWKPSSCPITIQIPECASTSYTISGLDSNVYEIQVRRHTQSGYGEPYTQKISFWKF